MLILDLGHRNRYYDDAHCRNEQECMECVFLSNVQVDTSFGKPMLCINNHGRQNH